MICEFCRHEADLISSRPKEHHEELIKVWRHHNMGHDQCTGCDCQHKNVGAWRGE